MLVNNIFEDDENEKNIKNYITMFNYFYSDGL